MPGRSEDHKAELIARVTARVEGRVKGERSSTATSFIPELYRHVPPQDLLETSEENLYGSALSLLAFGQRRAPNEARVRLLNPRLEDHGWKSSHTVVEVINDDMPFLVDSLIAELTRLDATVHLVIHPILRVARDAQGDLLALDSTDREVEGGVLESWMHIEISEQALGRHDEIRDGLLRTLADVRASVEDWPQMRERCLGLIAELENNPPPLPAEEIREGLDLLRWIEDDHFTFLGFREYRFDGEGSEAVVHILEDGGLGVLRDVSARVFDGIRNFGLLPADVRQFLREPRLLIITKSNQRSRVHRAVVYDAIAVKAFDEHGNVIGERVFVGLFTSVAYSRSPMRIPILREKVQRTIERAGFPPRSHDGKTLMHILETFPRDELFQVGEDELFEIATGILHLQERQRIALFTRRDPFERFVSCLVYVPRDRYDTTLRLRFQEILAAAWNGRVTAFYTHLTDSTLARLHFIVKTVPGRVPKVDAHEVEAKLIESARSWRDRLQQALVETRGEERGLALMRTFGASFPSSYHDHFTEQEAVLDIARIEEVVDRGRVAMNLYRPIEGAEETAKFKVYGAGPTVALADILPMLENLGFKVVDEIPYVLMPSGRTERVWIRDFSMTRIDGLPFGITEVREDFHQVFAAVWNGAIENDGFNRLVLAGLDLREVTAVRAWAKYLRQAQIPFSQAYMEQTLAAHPEVARLLVDLFAARFDPDLAEDARPTLIDSIASRLDGALDRVSNLDEDRILRRFRNLVESTLRTNFYQLDGEEPKGYLSFKLDSRGVEDLPLPRPFREIWVYSPRMEAIHLRGGKVARGGIRWSDRREDFRTEVLGLMKAQMVKNAVIVPVGSKGGFVCKQLPASGVREEVASEVEECYRTMMRGLLDITDNLQGEAVVPPPRVVRLDDDDPYLVVAADKGTATFSDLANRVAAEYGFWLGDAFASGGSAGYDHKRMGITARGAWEGVKRHFRELDKDIQHEAFTVVGVGDMSGDVFGNGMLLSRQIRLLAAFDHRHVFVDPDPDPERSWHERQRLFELPRSSWADYDRSLISEGGGVFERRAKSIPLSPQLQKLLGSKAAALAPHELIKGLLRLDVELLWFGGIGTYVKAADESHADVGDRANELLRIDATELRCKVIGEGANLGMTQRSRIEAALGGVSLNTDFIDNSAGVDTSDHEVNIKILLSEVETAGDMTRKQRDTLLAEMTDEVAELVLRDNYLQTQSVSVTQILGPRLVDRLARWMRTLEKSGRLDRGIEFLPDDEEIADRITTGLGLTRPELSILLAYSKIALFEELVASDLPDDPAMIEDLKLYFPTALRERFAATLGRHRLRREIVATMVTNGIVNRVGASFVHEVREKTGMPPADIARAYVAAREVFRLRGMWTGIEALDNLAPAAIQATMLAECGRLVERATVWFLRTGERPLEIGSAIAVYGPGVAEIQDNLDELLPRHAKKHLREETKRLIADRVPEQMARRIAALPLLSPACELVRIALEVGVPIPVAARTYYALGDRFGFDWLRRAALRLPSETVWDKLAATAIVDDLGANQADLARNVLASAEGGEVEIARWARSRRLEVTRVDQLLAELQATGGPTFPMLAVANRHLKALAG